MCLTGVWVEADLLVAIDEVGGRARVGTTGHAPDPPVTVIGLSHGKAGPGARAASHGGSDGQLTEKDDVAVEVLLRRHHGVDDAVMNENEALPGGRRAKVVSPRTDRPQRIGGKFKSNHVVVEVADAGHLHLGKVVPLPTRARPILPAMMAQT